MKDSTPSPDDHGLLSAGQAALLLLPAQAVGAAKALAGGDSLISLPAPYSDAWRCA